MTCVCLHVLKCIESKFTLYKIKSNSLFFHVYINIYLMSFEIPTLFSCGRENSTFVKYTVTRHQNFSKRGLTEEKIAMNFLSHCLSPNVKVNMA